MKELLSQYMPGHAMYMVRCDIADRYYRNQSDVLYGPKKENEEKTQNADIYQQMFTKKSNEDDDNVDDSAKDDDNSVGGVDEE